ncbi:uncharacterized protein LOC104884594 [Beta vulgaris subsp. vulgaris]|uniref:uncharacterized protein LOC104884594 n=1 Tax=Beta vulgaris subsp. vulgaris TaxID=3555 RepID=UPI002546B4B7|nr:uncharacterized protein LOC104884594 [Beta vulgaris subsp. vulgaris]
METILHCSSSLIYQVIPSLSSFHQHKIFRVAFKTANSSLHTSLSCTASSTGALCSAGDRQRRINSLESQFCYDKAIPEQIIGENVGLSVAEKEIGDKCRCGDCQAKGAVLCTTCGGSGLYVDSILECQGIIVKVRCLSKIFVLVCKNCFILGLLDA